MSDKFILDACCGGRMFWKNKKHPNAIFMDKRIDILPLKERWNINFSVEPDIQGDFTNMSFNDNEFKMVIFDPPHLLLNNTSWMAKKYGTLKGIDWKVEIKKGFDECWRVLDNYGTLIFKWNDNQIAFKELEKLFPAEPIIFNKMSRRGKSKTYWVVFMKIPNVLKGDCEEYKRQGALCFAKEMFKELGGDKNPHFVTSKIYLKNRIKELKVGRCLNEV